MTYTRFIKGVTLFSGLTLLPLLAQTPRIYSPNPVQICTASGCVNLGTGGGSGVPGGSANQIQWNNAGAFGGFTVNGDALLNTATGLITISKTNGVSFSPSATIDTTNASNISTGTLALARLPAGIGGLLQVNDIGTVANIYSLCLPGSPALTDGTTVLFRPAHTNTGNSTVAYCGGASKKLLNSDSTETGPGQVPVSPISLWNGGATIPYGSPAVIGDLVFDAGTNQNFISLINGVGSIGNLAQLMPVLPTTVMLVYHQKIDRWEVHTLPRQATDLEAAQGQSNSVLVSAYQVGLAINAIAPLAKSSPTKYQTAQYNGIAWTASEPATNPGSGRTSREWIIDGSLILKGRRMSPSLTGCSTTPTAIDPTSIVPMMLSFSTGGTANGVSCFISNGVSFPVYAGKTIKFDTMVKVSATTTVSYLFGLLGSTVAISASPLSYTSGNYQESVAAFRYNTGITPTPDNHWKCIAAVNASSAPTVVDAGATYGTVDGNLHQFQILIDDVANTIHYLIDGNEVCSPTSWASNIPAGSSMTPYLGQLQLAVFGAPQTFSFPYLWVESN